MKAFALALLRGLHHRIEYGLAGSAFEEIREVNPILSIEIRLEASPESGVREDDLSHWVDHEDRRIDELQERKVLAHTLPPSDFSLVSTTRMAPAFRSFARVRTVSKRSMAERSRMASRLASPSISEAR